MLKTKTAKLKQEYEQKCQELEEKYRLQSCLILAALRRLATLQPSLRRRWRRFPASSPISENSTNSSGAQASTIRDKIHFSCHLFGSLDFFPYLCILETKNNKYD
jgi:hypothetical protein